MGKLCIKLPDGSEVTARVEEWLAALIVSLPPAERQALCERVQKRVTLYSTPGSHVLQAEGGLFGTRGG